MSQWSTITKTNYILADIFDQISVTNAMLKMLITKKKGKKPEPYKRPGTKETRTKRMGKKPLANANEMREWIRKRQVRKDGV